MSYPTPLTPGSLVTKCCLKITEPGYVEPYYEIKGAALMLAGEVLDLLEALKAIADDVEKVARDSFSTVDGNFDDDYRTEDPEGYAVWASAKAAIAKATGGAA
ncbi:MAG TPA: hypothetical protein VK638_46990 [Edaphobacter sp.]|nr:hypothetical protein [Edaphobacter sp.]